MPIPTQNKMHVEIHHDIISKHTHLCVRAGGHWIKGSVTDIIVTAANRVWERGHGDNWFNHARINRRGDCQFVNGRPA